MSVSLSKALKLGGADDETIFSGPSQLSTEFEVAVQSIPSNFFDVVFTDLYVSKSEQDIEDIDYLSNGDLNPVQLLYSNASLSEYPSTDPAFNNKNAYLTTFSADWETPYVAQAGTSETFTTIIPSALANKFALEAGDIVKLMQSKDNDFTTRFQIRSTASAMPGLLFTDYQTTMMIYDSSFGVPMVITDDAFSKMLE